MKRLLLACAAAAALVAAASVYAQTTATRHVFVAVDALEVKSNQFTVTGVVDGESAPRTVSLYLSSSSTTSRDDLAACQRLALLAMTKPGQYRFEMLQSSSYLVACKLARVTP